MKPTETNNGDELSLDHLLSWYRSNIFQSNLSTNPETFVVPRTSFQSFALPDLSAEMVERVTCRTVKAMGSWQLLEPADRAKIIREWAMKMRHFENELVEIVSIELGCPARAAIQEVHYAASFLDWFAGEAERIHGEILPSSVGRSIIVDRVPIGVVGALTPWNAPLSMVTRKCGAAIAAGCGVLLRPSERTPYSALALARLGEIAGLPRNLLLPFTTMDASGFLESACSNYDVRKITFTGSTSIGRVVGETCGRYLKPCTLELGGNAAFIVLSDANLNVATHSAMTAKFRANGQSCVAANRFFVHDSHAEAFVQELSNQISSLSVDDTSTSDVWPVFDTQSYDRINKQVDELIKMGATVVYKHPVGSKERIVAPVILHMSDVSLLAKVPELFGPVIVYGIFQNEAEIVSIVNQPDAGLVNYIMSENIEHAQRLANKFEVGMIGINTGIVSSPSIPFGGVRNSGFGREGSQHGVEEFLVLKYQLSVNTSEINNGIVNNTTTLIPSEKGNA